jgi:hypothetical protein
MIFRAGRKLHLPRRDRHGGEPARKATSAYAAVPPIPGRVTVSAEPTGPTSPEPVVTTPPADTVHGERPAQPDDMIQHDRGGAGRGGRMITDATYVPTMTRRTGARKLFESPNSAAVDKRLPAARALCSSAKT